MLKILVVDDDAELNRTVCKFLTSPDIFANPFTNRQKCAIIYNIEA